MAFETGKVSPVFSFIDRRGNSSTHEGVEVFIPSKF